MSKRDNKDLVTGGFLSFSLMAQEFIAIMFAFYSYRQGEMALATFYLAVAGLLIVALGLFYIFDHHRLARVLLASTLLTCFFFLLLGASDASALMWCLTVVPVLVGAFDHRQSLAMLIILFAAATWIMFGGSMPIAVPEYSDTVVVRFLSSYAILAAFAVAMDNSRFDSLTKYKDLSSRVDEITHQDVLTQLPNRHNMEGRLAAKYQQYRLGKQPFSILLADLDNFKFINDRYGHDVGDEILYAIFVRVSSVKLCLQCDEVEVQEGSSRPSAKVLPKECRTFAYGRNMQGGSMIVVVPVRWSSSQTRLSEQQGPSSSFEGVLPLC